FRSGKHRLDEGQNAQSNLPEEFVARHLIGPEIVQEQAGVVIRHLFEVGNYPVLVHGVTMESAANLVVNASAAHTLERGGDRSQQPVLTRLQVRVEQEVDRARVGNL